MVRHLSRAVSRVAAGGGNANQCRQENLVRETGRVPHVRWQRLQGSDGHYTGHHRQRRAPIADYQLWVSRPEFPAQRVHGVWFLDAITFLNQVRAVRDQKAGGFALYRLGSEDQAIWDALNVPHNFNLDNQTRQALELIKSTDTITDVGDGEIVTVDEDRTDGMRKLAVDADGYLTANYVKFAEFPTLYHQGAGGEHQVALTFDDGPDPRWTPKVLDILKAANVKATFFVVGVNAERYPALVRRIFDEGHEIGNHTYYHPNLALCWPEHIRLELNATQLLLETITGRATTLFRPPYAADTGPTDLSELTPLKIAEDLNYLVVLENIDPQDWAKPGADIILRRIKQQRHDGSVILLHDAGGAGGMCLAHVFVV